MWFCGRLMQSSVVGYLVRYSFVSCFLCPSLPTRFVWRIQLIPLCFLSQGYLQDSWRTNLPSCLLRKPNRHLPQVTWRERAENPGGVGVFHSIWANGKGVEVGGLLSIKDSSLSPCSSRTHGQLLEWHSYMRHLLDLGYLFSQLLQILECWLVPGNNRATCPLLRRSFTVDGEDTSINGLINLTGWGINGPNSSGCQKPSWIFPWPQGRRASTQGLSDAQEWISLHSYRARAACTESKDM